MSTTTIDFTSFLKLMAHQKASDLFITAGMPPAIKVNGKISPITQTPLTPQQSRDLVLNVMTPAQREEFEKTHECNFAIGLSGVGRFRVSCFYQRNQVGMVLRRIETRIPTVEELSLPPIIKTLAMTKRGIILRRVGGYSLPNALRMTIGDEEANRLVVGALKDFLGSKA